jgi:hypothetical protein
MASEIAAPRPAAAARAPFWVGVTYVARCTATMWPNSAAASDGANPARCMIVANVCRTSSVETDTHTWRKDADLCFRFIDDHLTFDPKYHIMATDFQAALSAWLLDLGHQKWSDKTVTARFGDYEAFVQQHVIKKKIRGTSSFIPRLPQEMRFYPDRAAAQAHVDNVPVSYAAWCGSVGKARPL